MTSGIITRTGPRKYVRKGCGPLKSSRFNVVDVVIVLLIAFTLIFVAKKFAPRTGATAKATRMEAVFVSNPMPIWTSLMPHLASGDAVEAVLGGTAYPFGTLASAKLLPSMVAAPTSQGTWKAASDPLSRKIELTVTVQASAGKNGYTVNANPVYLGQEVILEAGSVQLTGYIKTIHP